MAGDRAENQGDAGLMIKQGGTLAGCTFEGDDEKHWCICLWYPTLSDEDGKTIKKWKFFSYVVI